MAPDRWRMSRPWHLSPAGVHRPTWRSRRCGRSLSSCGTNSGWWGKQRTLDGEKVCINGYGHPQVWSWYTLISDVYWNMEQSWQKVCLWSFNAVFSQQANWDDWDNSLYYRYLRTSYLQQKRDNSDTRMALILDDPCCSDPISGRVFMAEIGPNDPRLLTRGFLQDQKYRPRFSEAFNTWDSDLGRFRRDGSIAISQLLNRKNLKASDVDKIW